MRVLGYATSLSLFVPGAIIYSLLGFFGAAAYGPATSGNILINKWGNKYVQVVLNIAIARMSSDPRATHAFLSPMPDSHPW